MPAKAPQLVPFRISSRAPFSVADLSPVGISLPPITAIVRVSRFLSLSPLALTLSSSVRHVEHHRVRI